MILSVLAIACILLIAAALFRRMVGARGGDEAAPPVSRCYEWEGSYTEAFQRALDVLGALGSAVVQADPHRGVIAGRMAPSLLSFAPLGALFRVTLATRGETTFVEVRASPLVSLLPSIGAWSAATLHSRFEEIWLRLPLPASSRAG